MNQNIMTQNPYGHLKGCKRYGALTTTEPCTCGVGTRLISAQSIKKEAVKVYLLVRAVKGYDGYPLVDIYVYETLSMAVQAKRQLNVGLEPHEQYELKEKEVLAPK